MLLVIPSLNLGDHIILWGVQLAPVVHSVVLGACFVGGIASVLVRGIRVISCWAGFPKSGSPWGPYDQPERERERERDRQREREREREKEREKERVCVYVRARKGERAEEYTYAYGAHEEIMGSFLGMARHDFETKL